MPDTLARYLAQSTAVQRLVAGLTRDELARPLAPGKWSTHQLAVHLYDSDLVGCDRLRRTLAMERPLLMGYDENAYVARLPAAGLDAAAVGEAFRVNRALTAELLRAAPADALARSAVHSERGLVTLAQLLEGYVQHIDHHMEFGAGKRRALGKPLAP